MIVYYCFQSFRVTCAYKAIVLFERSSNLSTVFPLSAASCSLVFSLLLLTYISIYFRNCYPVQNTVLIEIWNILLFSSGQTFIIQQLSVHWMRIRWKHGVKYDTCNPSYFHVWRQDIPEPKQMVPYLNETVKILGVPKKIIPILVLSIEKCEQHSWIKYLNKRILLIWALMNCLLTQLSVCSRYTLVQFLLLQRAVQTCHLAYCFCAVARSCCKTRRGQEVRSGIFGGWCN